MSKHGDAWAKGLPPQNICHLCKMDCKMEGDTSECLMFVPKEEK